MIPTENKTYILPKTTAMKTKKQKTLAELKKDLELISKKELTQIVGGKKEKPKLTWTIKCGGLIPQ
ncbi:hypothetical protein MASR1M65_33070 [Saprospiraceae bacterium]